MTEAEQIRDEFIAECKNVMGFLVTKHGFSGPEIVKNPWGASVTYFKRDIGIECSLDGRDEMISVYLVRLENGKMPEIDYFRHPIGFVNNKGEVVQERLGILIRNRQADITVDAHGISKRRADFRRSLLIEKHILTEHGKSVLAGSADIFKKPLPSDREKVLSAWDKKDYEQVVALYKSLQPGLLNQNDKNRLAYAVNRVREKAETAWNKKVYAEVVRLYELMKPELTEEELNRFEYAKKQL
jgi:hypothetical protein